ncbi:SCP2 sterol-binding domain-containing protein [Aspergillus similis]
MTLEVDGFESSAAFDATVVAFTLKNKGGKEESWHLDLKDTGVAGKGAAPAGGNADVTLQLSDSDFGSLVAGKANAQRLSLGGKLKIKGNIMKTTKMKPVLKKAQGKAKLDFTDIAATPSAWTRP